jgi:RNA polymerase sigma factor (sigma-70 family)
MSDVIPREDAELERFAGSLRPLLRRLVGDALADDVLQDTWVAALKRPPADGRNPWGWLRAVARNIAWKRRRAEGRRRRREAQVARERAVRSASGGPDVLALHRRLLDAVYALDAPLREVVVGRYLEGTSSRALARQLNVSRATVDRRLEAALAALRVRLAPPDRDGRPLTPAIVFGAPWESHAPGPATAAALAGGGVMGAKYAVAGVALVLLGWLALDHLAGRTEPRADAPSPRPELAAAGPGPRLEGRAHEPTASVVATATPRADQDPEAWLRRLDAAPDGEEVRRILLELGRLPPKDGLAVLRAIYDRIGKPEVRHHVLDHFAHLARLIVHVYAPSILDLGIRDPDAEVAAVALALSGTYALRPLSLEDGTYDAWRAEILDQPVSEVFVRAARHGARRLVRLEGEAFRRMVKEVGDLHAWLGRSSVYRLDIEAVVREEGAWEWAHRLWSDPAGDTDTRISAVQFLACFGLKEPFFSSDLVPVLTGRAEVPAPLAAFVVHLVADRKGVDAWELLLQAFARHPPAADGEALVWAVLATTMERMARPRAIPTLIAALDHRPLYPTTRGFLGLALAGLAGVPHDPATQDAAWWRAWWLENRSRFPAEVAVLGVPDALVPAR